MLGVQMSALHLLALQGRHMTDADWEKVERAMGRPRSDGRLVKLALSLRALRSPEWRGFDWAQPTTKGSDHDKR